jgi:hypothetical protein
MPNGAAVSTRNIREWDAAESAAALIASQAVSAQANPALIALSLLSPQLQAACSNVADALARTVRARRRKEARPQDRQRPRMIRGKSRQSAGTLLRSGERGGA